MTEKSPDHQPAWFREAVRQLHGRFDRLEREVERIKAEPFIKFEVFMTKTFNLNISDSQIANLAVDAQQTIGSIDQKIGALKDDRSAKELADALGKLTKAVSTSHEIASADERTELLDGIEELLTQAERPPAARKRGIIKPLVDSIANACESAGGLATAWQVAGPAIRAFFGF